MFSPVDKAEYRISNLGDAAEEYVELECWVKPPWMPTKVLQVASQFLLAAMDVKQDELGKPQMLGPGSRPQLPGRARRSPTSPSLPAARHALQPSSRRKPEGGPAASASPV